MKPLLGKAVIPDDSPYTTGGLGLLGTAPSQDAMKDCDTLIIAGSSFPYMEFYPKPGRPAWSRSTLDPPALACAPRSRSAWPATAARLEALTPHIQQKKDRKFLETAQKGMKAMERFDDEAGHEHG